MTAYHSCAFAGVPPLAILLSLVCVATPPVAFALPPWDDDDPRRAELGQRLDPDHLAPRIARGVERRDLTALQRAYAGAVRRRTARAVRCSKPARRIPRRVARSAEPNLRSCSKRCGREGPRRRRSQSVERITADGKQHRKLRRFSGRGLRRVSCQVALTVLAHNLLTLLVEETKAARNQRDAKGGNPVDTVTEKLDDL